jgi:hypothetical protein
MNIQSCRLKLFVLLVLALVGMGVVSVAFSAAPAKRALLIGIDKYKADSVRNLRGCVNDTELMRGILVGKFNFSSENIKILRNQDATREKIIKSIQTELIAKAGPKDIIVLHYSGHGSRMIDVSGDETDGYDETLVTFDSRTEKKFDLSDDEINGLLKQLTQITKNVTFIFDSCHSGAAARAGNTTRQIEADERHPPIPADFALGARGAGEGEADFRLNSSDYVLISGCMATELSNERTFNARHHGALTWFLSQALGTAGNAATYKSIMDEVRTEVASLYPSQHPQLEGPGADLQVFGTDRINAQPYIRVEPMDENGVKLDGGMICGVRPKSILQVYKAETVEFDGATPVATIEVTEAKDFEAYAKIKMGGPVPQHAKAVMEAIMLGDTLIPVYLSSHGEEPLKQIEKALAKYNVITLVDNEADARLIVAVDNGRIEIRSGDLQLLGPPVLMTEDNYVEKCIEQVRDLVHWMMVLDLKNPKGGLQIGFDIRRQADQVDITQLRAVPPDALLTYRVVNKDEVPLYVYVLDVSSDGSIALLYPRITGAQEQLSPGKTVEMDIEMFVPDGYDEVVDVLKVIAATRAIDPSIFPQGAMRSAPPPPVKRALEDPLAQFFARSVRGEMRGSRPIEVKSWATVQKAVVVRRP